MKLQIRWVMMLYANIFMQCYNELKNKSMFWNTEQAELYTNQLWWWSSYVYWKVLICCDNLYDNNLFDASQWL